MLTEKVDFYSQGLRLSGLYYQPEVRDPRFPAVIVCGGLGAIKEMIVPDIASRLVSSGFPVLAFDYRGFGESEGTRFQLDPGEQAEDVCSAMSFLSGHTKNTDIVLYGNSFGAGVAVCAAAKDKRAKGVVGVVGVYDGESWLRSLRTPWDWEEFIDAVDRDRMRRVAGEAGMWVEPSEVMPADPESKKWAMEVAARFPQRAYRLSLEAAGAIMEWRPVDAVRRISPRPLLIVAADRDVLVPSEQSQAVASHALEPKELVWLHGARHHDATQSPRLTEVLDKVETWLSLHFVDGDPAPGAVR